jgi:hypothetical protein
MITCNLKGGLGNQMFEIFATIAYALSNKDIFFFKNTPSLNNGVTKRYTYWHNFFICIKSFLSNQFINMDIVREKSFTYEKLPDKIIITQNIILDGYFQSPKYFEEHYEKIYHLLRMDDLKKKVTQKYNYNYKDFISVHFRVGDFKVLQDKHPIMPVEYYKNSIQLLLNKIKSKQVVKILYFCEQQDNDDVNKMITLLSDQFSNCAFIKANDQIADWEQLLMMSSCGHNIIANSTFSWWGAYLNSNPLKTVCYPETWFGPKLPHDTCDLFPETWIKVPCV